MQLCRVIGNVFSTPKNKELENHKILVVHPIDLEGNFIDKSYLALDVVDAGEGDNVIVLNEGGSVRIFFNNEKIPLRSLILGIVDYIEVEGEFKDLHK